MHSALPLFLEPDTVDHIDWIAGQLAHQRGVAKVSRSDAVAWVVRNHWKKMHKQHAASKARSKRVA